MIAVFTAFIFDKLALIWLGENVVRSSILYSIVFSTFTITSLWINTASCLANGLNKLYCQIRWSIIGAIVKSPLSLLFVKLTGDWIGVVIANIIALLPLLIFQSIQNEKTLKKLKNAY